METVDTLDSNRPTFKKLKYESLLDFAEEIIHEIEKQKDLISPKTKDRLLAEVNRIIVLMRTKRDHIESEMTKKINYLNKELAPYNEEKERLEEEYSDNELLYNEKIIENSEYEKHKNEIKNIIETCKPKIEQIKQKLDILEITPPRKTIKMLESLHFKEEELNKLWQLTHVNKKSHMSFDSNSFGKGENTIKILREYQEGKNQKKEKLDRLEKIKTKLSQEKFEEKHRLIIAGLDKSQDEYQKLENEVKDKITMIKKDIKDRKLILSDLNIELKDIIIMKKNKIPLKKYISEKFTLLTQEIGKCKEELKILESLLEIYTAEGKKPQKNILNILKNLRSKEEKLNALPQVTQNADKSAIPTDSEYVTKETDTISKLRKYKENVDQNKEKLDRLEKVRAKLSNDKFEEKYKLLKADLDKSQEEYQKLESEIKNKISLIKKEMQERNQILADLNTELTDASTIKKNKMPLKNYLLDKFTNITEEIKKHKEELKIFESFTNI